MISSPNKFKSTVLEVPEKYRYCNECELLTRQDKGNCCELCGLKEMTDDEQYAFCPNCGYAHDRTTASEEGLSGWLYACIHAEGCEDYSKDCEVDFEQSYKAGESDCDCDRHTVYRAGYRRNDSYLDHGKDFVGEYSYSWTYDIHCPCCDCEFEVDNSSI